MVEVEEKLFPDGTIDRLKEASSRRDLRFLNAWNQLCARLDYLMSKRSDVDFEWRGDNIYVKGEEGEVTEIVNEIRKLGTRLHLW